MSVPNRQPEMRATRETRLQRNKQILRIYPEGNQDPSDADMKRVTPGVAARREGSTADAGEALICCPALAPTTSSETQFPLLRCPLPVSPIFRGLQPDGTHPFCVHIPYCVLRRQTPSKIAGWEMDLDLIPVFVRTIYS